MSEKTKSSLSKTIKKFVSTKYKFDRFKSTPELSSDIRYLGTIIVKFHDLVYVLGHPDRGSIEEVDFEWLFSINNRRILIRNFNYSTLCSSSIPTFLIEEWNVHAKDQTDIKLLKSFLKYKEVEVSSIIELANLITKKKGEWVDKG